MNYKRLFYLVIIAGLFNSCKKEEVVPPQGTASLTIINAVVGSILLRPNFGGTDSLPNYFYNAFQINYNSYLQSSTNYNQGNEFNTHSGVVRLGVYNLNDTLPTNGPLFNLTLDPPIGSISTLFLTGTVPLPDTVFVKDDPPFFPSADSSLGVRFVNLSPGSDPVSVNISGLENGSAVNSLAYKSITGFNKYAANADINSYTFEFRNAETGELLTSYTMSDINNDGSDPNKTANLWRYRNVTLALLGSPKVSDAVPQTILAVLNY